MGLTQTDFEVILDDTSKRIDVEIVWRDDEDHSPSKEFIVEIFSDTGWPIFLRGSFNPLIPSLTFALIHKATGRIYGLDIGKNHRNPQGNDVGDVHKHKWSEIFRDKEAYSPDDLIIKSIDSIDVIDVWNQFCREAKIEHNGKMFQPPPIQRDLFI